MKESKWPYFTHYRHDESALLARKHGDCSKGTLGKITSNIRHLLTSVRGRIDGWFQFGLQIPLTHAPPVERKELGEKQVEEEGG